MAVDEKVLERARQSRREKEAAEITSSLASAEAFNQQNALAEQETQRRLAQQAAELPPPGISRRPPNFLSPEESVARVDADIAARNAEAAAHPTPGIRFGGRDQNTVLTSGKIGPAFREL